MGHRILLVDDEEEIRSFVADALKKDGHEITSAISPSEALDVAAKTRFDLFIIDVNLPEMNGFELREKLRKHPGGSNPVLFLTGAPKELEVEIAQKLKGDKLLLKPVAQADLRRAAKVALKLVRAEAGPIPDALDRIAGIVARDRESGVLTAMNGATLKRVVFRDGKVAFAASNDPREVIGQAFVRSGLITEKDLAAALSQREASGGKPLGVVLTALRKVTKEQAEKVFVKKIREAVLELFLWKTGMAEFVGSVEESDQPFPIALDLAPLAAEGRKRRERWQIVRKFIPDPSMKFAVKAWPAGFPKNEGDRVLAKHVESGRSMAEIMVELRGQDYAVGVRLAELVKSGALATQKSTGFVAPVPPHTNESVTVDMDDAVLDEQPPRDVDDGSSPPDEIPNVTRVLGRPPVAEPVSLDAGAMEPLEEAPEPARTPRRPTLSDSIPGGGGMPETVGMLTRALVLMRAGDLQGARAGIMDVLHLDPLNPLARQRLTEIEAALTLEARKNSGLNPNTRLKLGVKLEELVGKPILANDAFVLTRLAGTSLTIAELIQICPLPENELWQVVERHLATGILARA